MCLPDPVHSSVISHDAPSSTIGWAASARQNLHKQLSRPRACACYQQRTGTCGVLAVTQIKCFLLRTDTLSTQPYASATTATHIAAGGNTITAVADNLGWPASAAMQSSFAANSPNASRRTACPTCSVSGQQAQLHVPACMLPCSAVCLHQTHLENS